MTTPRKPALVWALAALGAALALVIGIWLAAERLPPAGASAQRSAPLAAAREPGLRRAAGKRPLPTFVAASAEAYEAQLDAPDAREPVEFYRAEAREEPWAGAMEQALQRRFDRAEVQRAGLLDLRLEAVDCRRSSCQLEISWSPADVAATGKSAESVRVTPDPLGHFQLRTGDLASVSTRLEPPAAEPALSNSYHVRVRKDVRQAVTEILLFGAATLNPENQRPR